MGLIAQRSTSGGADIPPGERLRFGIKKAVEDWGDHGPQVRKLLEVLAGEYKGETITDWSSLAQPRTDFVAALRKKDYSDEKIAEILRKEGFEFDDIDEHEETVKVGETGKLMNILMAAFNGNVEAIDSAPSIPALLEALEGRSFISITKKRGKDKKYTGITWDQIYTDPDAGTVDPEQDFDDIPF
jgi:hypothetical protein